MTVPHKVEYPAPSEASKRSRDTSLVRVKGLNPLWGLGAKPLAEYEAEPHSAQADKVQIVVSKAYRSQTSDKSDIGE